MYLNLIARSVFALALTSAGAMACKEVAADPSGCAGWKREFISDAGRKYVLSPSGYLTPNVQRISRENVAQYAALAAVTALDWHSTTRMTASGRGREGNPLIASNGHASTVRFSIMSGAAVGMWLLHDLYLKPRAAAQEKHESRSVRIIRWSMLAGRTAIVVNNYAR